MTMLRLQLWVVRCCDTGVHALDVNHDTSRPTFHGRGRSSSANSFLDETSVLLPAAYYCCVYTKTRKPANPRWRVESGNRATRKVKVFLLVPGCGSKLATGTSSGLHSTASLVRLGFVGHYRNIRT